MKYFFYLAFLFPCFHLSAQENIDSANEKMAASDSASYYYGAISAIRDKNTTFEVNREKILYRKTFQVNSAKTSAEVYDRALGFARMMNANYKADKKALTIRIPISWQYDAGINECIEDLSLNGTLIVEVKDIKTRISLTDINYEHHDKTDAEIKPVAQSDFFSKRPDCAPAKGKAELLYNCTQCRQSLRSLDKKLKSKFEDFASQYQESLKKY